MSGARQEPALAAPPERAPDLEPPREPASPSAREDPVRAIAQAVLYEGYLLWPYRRSALKNRQRWTFGALHPRDWCRARGADEPWSLRAECLIEAAPDVRVEVRVRFLQVVERRVAWRESQGLRFVDRLELGDDREILAFEEASERELDAGGFPLRELATPRVTPIEVAAGIEQEPLRSAAGADAAIVRCWQRLRGAVVVEAERVAAGLYRVRVEVANTTPQSQGDRSAVMRHSFASTHVVLRAPEGRFVSATDPPEALRPAAEACCNQGVWPVLVGEQGERHTVLASPIILEDHPRIAPESPGDFFDASEIDGLLVLSLLSLGEAERREMQATDPRAREILARTDALPPEALRRLHGAIRRIREVEA